MEKGNSKYKGEKAVKFVIAELARWDMEIALPMSDNLPFDLVIIYKGKLFKVQVKSSTRSPNKGSEPTTAICFSCRTSNWWKKENKKYTISDFDILIGYDFIGGNTYLFGPEDFVNKNSISIRKSDSQNMQKAKCHFSADYIISQQRIDLLFSLEK